MRFGSGDLSMYKDIGAMDTGPGYLNGILSLLLNTTDPASHYSEEEQRAVPYFHRSRAAELIAFLDQKFPNAASRPELHARLIEAYGSKKLAAGADDRFVLSVAVIRLDQPRMKFGPRCGVGKLLVKESNQLRSARAMEIGHGTLLFFRIVRGRIGGIQQQR